MILRLLGAAVTGRECVRNAGNLWIVRCAASYTSARHLGLSATFLFFLGAVGCIVGYAMNTRED